MAYYRRVGDVPPKRHTQHRRPDGGLYAEELMGEEGFSSDSALLYHRELPSAMVDARTWQLPDQTLTPNQPLALNNPAARVFPDDWKSFGKADKFPHAATTYRLTEHFHYWTKHARLNAIIQPDQFVEIGEALAQELGIVSGNRVRVESNRGHIEPPSPSSPISMTGEFHKFWLSLRAMIGAKRGEAFAG